MIYTLTNRTTRQTHEIDVVTDTAARLAAEAFSRDTGGPIRVTDDKGRVIARAIRSAVTEATSATDCVAESADAAIAPAGFTLAVFEDIALSMIRAGHGRTDLIAAANRASDRRTQEVAATTYGRQA
jgi:hypothetical protein